ncbi:MAG: DNA mismatch repair protein MutS, partial [Firmicutes bacterium]|nr:DNA mismatch repair protein MutS [Bacillota bacterium]
IKEGRHPVLERVMGPGRFVPNDIHLDGSTRIMLITGPNMSGKSTLLASTALIVYMAHMGSFVPAACARIGLVDAIYYRTGSYEDLAGGRSTFLVELSEVANILNTATHRSLVLIDELGRGTSTYDGMSLAQATLEYLHDAVRCRALFTTHYHELASLEQRLEGVRNFHVTAVERGGELTFLYKLTRGSVDKSYGVNVARMAGLPREVVRRAAAILEAMERMSPSRPRQESLLGAGTAGSSEPQVDGGGCAGI